MIIMKYPKYKDYEKIYKRFFNKGVNYLIEKANISKEDKILDICGGNGRLTRELKKLCDNVNYLDREKDMIPDDLESLGIKVYNEDIENFVMHTNERYTKVLCEQAVNYWLLHIDIKKFSNIISPNGLFIFNTFSNKPPTTPMIKEYSIDDIKYLEISYLVNNKVEHIQIREGFPPHYTEFDWISKEQYKELLSPYFDIELLDDGKSSLYICKRKNYE